MKPTTTTLYVAADGTEFHTEDECLQYERIFKPTLTRIGRAEALELANEQLGMTYVIPGKTKMHYGMCEIQQLLDQIYGFDSKGKSVLKVVLDDKP